LSLPTVEVRQYVHVTVVQARVQIGTRPIPVMARFSLHVEDCAVGRSRHTPVCPLCHSLPSFGANLDSHESPALQILVLPDERFTTEPVIRPAEGPGNPAFPEAVDDGPGDVRVKLLGCP